MFSALLGLRLVLGLLAVYHLAIGVISAFAPAWARRVAQGFYGIEVELEPGAQVGYAMRMLGLYALTLGFLLALATADPHGHRAVILAVIFLQSMRAAFRLLHRAELHSSFHVPAPRNVFNAGLLLAQVALLVAWFPA
jgi:hypothetical protein